VLHQSFVQQVLFLDRAAQGWVEDFFLDRGVNDQCVTDAANQRFLFGFGFHIFVLVEQVLHRAVVVRQ